MSPLDYYVLLALSSGPLYGYAIKDAVAAKSQGTVAPRAGSQYRVIGRFMSDGLVKEVDPAGEVEPHPGRARKYYALTGAGRAELLSETRRLKGAAAMAEKRLGIASGRS